mgnify:CR=1 FL=1
MRYIDRKEFASELAKISLSNEDITRYGDGFEKAIQLVYGVLNEIFIDSVSESVQLDADDIIAFLNDCETLEEAKRFADEHLR